MRENLISRAIATVGLQSLALACGVSYQAVRKWETKGRLPRTDYTGETDYATRIAAACREKDPASRLTRESLLGIGSQATNQAAA